MATIDSSSLNNFIAEPNNGLQSSSPSPAAPGAKRKIAPLEPEINDEVQKIKEQVIGIIKNDIPKLYSPSLDSYKTKFLIDYVLFSPEVPSPALETIKLLSKQLEQASLLPELRTKKPRTESSPTEEMDTTEAPSFRQEKGAATVSDLTSSDSSSSISQSNHGKSKRRRYDRKSSSLSKKLVIQNLSSKFAECETRINEEDIRLFLLQRNLIQAEKDGARAYNDLLQRNLIQARKDGARAYNDLSLKIHLVRQEIANSQLIQAELKQQQEALKTALISHLKLEKHKPSRVSQPLPTSQVYDN